MRLFVGMGLAAEATQALAAVRERFAAAGPSLRWSAPATWHVTLQFLGAAGDVQAACVVEKLGAVRAGPVPVGLAGLGFFERAGVFWAGVALTPELLALQQRVTAATRSCGFLPEEHAYHPHITLARARGRSGRDALAPLKKMVEAARVDLRITFTAEEFLLYESFPGSEGSRYEIRARFPLAGPL